MNGLGQYKFSPLNNTWNSMCDVIFELLRAWVNLDWNLQQGKALSAKTVAGAACVHPGKLNSHDTEGGHSQWLCAPQRGCPNLCQLRKAKKQPKLFSLKHRLCFVQLFVQWNTKSLKKEKKINWGRGNSQCCLWTAVCASLSALDANGWCLGCCQGQRSRR